MSIGVFSDHQTRKKKPIIKGIASKLVNTFNDYKTRHDTLCEAFMVTSNGLRGGTVKDLQEKVFWNMSRSENARFT